MLPVTGIGNEAEEKPTFTGQHSLAPSAERKIPRNPETLETQTGGWVSVGLHVHKSAGRHGLVGGRVVQGIGGGTPMQPKGYGVNP